MKRTLMALLGMRRLATVATVLMVTLVSVAAPGQTAQTYVVQDLGLLPGDSVSIASGINNLGWVVGYSDGPLGYRAFLWIPGAEMIALSGLADRPQSSARDINDVGQVIGTAFAGGGDLGHAVLWTDGLATDLGVLGIGPSSGGSGINARGDAVGYSYHNGPTLQDGTHAFVYTDASGMTDLTPTPEDNRAYATGINDSGQIAGYRGVYSHATRWIDGVAEDLGTLPGYNQSFGMAINASGQVAGHLVSPTGSSEVIFRYTDGVGMVNLGGLGQQNRVFGMNDRGDVVGRGRPVVGTIQRAFLYTDQSGLQDLNSLINPDSGWFLYGALDINNSGEIAAWGLNLFTNETRAVKLTPSG